MRRRRGPHWNGFEPRSWRTAVGRRQGRQTKPIDKLKTWLFGVLLRLQLRRPSESELRLQKRRTSGVESSRRRRKQQRPSDVDVRRPSDVEPRSRRKKQRPSDVECSDVETTMRRKQQRTRGFEPSRRRKMMPGIFESARRSRGCGR